MEFCSHLKPRKILLRDHLEQVGNRGAKILDSKSINNLDKQILSEVSYLIGICHDFGKYTTFFQEKLAGKRRKGDPLANHGLISALFSYEVINNYIKIKKVETEKPYSYLPLLSYFIIKHHHGNLDDITSGVNPDKLFNRGFRELTKQIADIKTNKSEINRQYQSLLDSLGISFEKAFSSLDKYAGEFKTSTEIKQQIIHVDRSLYFFEKDAKSTITYLLVQLLYSVLIDSDKKHAGNIREIERKNLPDNLVDEYLNNPDFRNENESNINDIRDAIRRSVIKNLIEPKNINQRIFTLTAPTGTGKTLASLSAALRLRKQLKKYLHLPYEPRIIYSLPFTSIIDQNYQVFDKVLNQMTDFRLNESTYLLKHHHLSEVFYKIKDLNQEEDVDESLALIESWESEIIVTTFIQLFYTLIGYKNRSLKKFHNIANSILILDEVQNIPIEYWGLTREILKAMTEYFDCRIILMTATKPLIFDEGEYLELVDNHEEYFMKAELNRVCLKINHENLTIKEFCDSLTAWSKKSYLFVFNTKNSSLEFYNEIRERVKGFKIHYLSTNVIPLARRKRINRIKKQVKAGEKVIVVSTQLIEAGVDIDCEVVYRDMGPLDSIIQVAGRGNRNKKRQQADVNILNLVSDKEESFTGIYSPVLIDIVKKLFEGKTSIPESEFLQLINAYFVEAKKKSTEERKIMEAILSLYYYDKTPDLSKRRPISRFELIKEKYYEIDVFAEVDGDAAALWKKYNEIKNREDLDPYERKNELLKIKKKFYDYVIAVPEKHANKVGYDEDAGIGRIPIEGISESGLYSLKTGFNKDADPKSKFC